MQLVECEVMRLGLDRSNNSYVVILREKEGERLLPIWIGQAEAESIVIEMSKLKRERPLTHDLCKTLITGMGGTLRRIQITKVENRTYYAELHIRVNEKMIQVDARPSDSIAIALRFSAPIFAQEDLLTSLSELERRSAQARAGGTRTALFFYYSGHAKDGALRLGSSQLPMESLKGRSSRTR